MSGEAGDNFQLLSILPMINPKPHPSRLFHWLAVAARWALAVLVALWLLLGAMAGVLHGFIVPRIDDHRGKLESLAARALGTPVRIGKVTAQSDGLIPSFALQDVSILDAQGQPAFTLSKAIVAVSARSLLRLGVEQIVLDEPRLQAVRNEYGQWSVAGLVPSDQSGSDAAPLDWLLKQPEIVVRDGLLQWQDLLLQQPMQSLEQVGVVLRNGAWKHSFRMDAKLPEPQGGGALQVMAQMRDPVWTSQHVWERWRGQWYLQADSVNLPVLPLPESWKVQSIAASQSSVKAWVDIRRGQTAGVVADVQLPNLDVVWASDVKPLALRNVRGRLDAQPIDGGWQVQALNWSFSLPNQQIWPASNVKLRFPVGEGVMPYALEASLVDLELLHALGQQLPLEGVPAAWSEWNVKGQVEQLQARWSPAHEGRKLSYHAQARLKGFTLRASDTQPASGTPQVEGLDLQFALDESGGSADVLMHAGALVFPGAFEEPRVPVQQLQAHARWNVDHDGRWKVEIPRASFANADASGSFQARWEMGQTSETQLPGRLQLNGVLDKANGARVHRYLPLAVPAEARHYVRDSVLAGKASNVRFRVDGDLAHFPFGDGKAGEFHIAAPVKDVLYHYVPARLLDAGSKPWPHITQLSGDLLFDKTSMQVKNAQGWFGEREKVQLVGIDAEIPQLDTPVLRVNGHGKAELPAWLGVVRNSAIGELTSHALDATQSNGPASLTLDLHLPIHDLSHAKVKGVVGLHGNQFRLRPDVPELQNAQGSVHFSEAGFQLQDVYANALGGSVKAQGGLIVKAGVAPALDIHAQGRATAQGLRDDGFLSPVSWFAVHASGATDYEVRVGLDKALPQVLVQTDLQGMEINLPAPAGKLAEEKLPLRVQQQSLRSIGGDQETSVGQRLSVSLLDRAQVLYDLDYSQEAVRVLGGALLVGKAAVDRSSVSHAALKGVRADVRVPMLEVDDWLAILPESEERADAASRTESSATDYLQYMPQQLALQTPSLTVHGRTLQNVQVQALQTSGVWRADVQAQELAGQLEYQPTGSIQYPHGLVHARLSHLRLPDSAGTQADSLLQSSVRQMPALDIEVDRLTIADRFLGRLEVQARNVQKQGASVWELSQFDMSLPEAVLAAQGTWGGADAQSRHTALQFALSLKDTGKLLDRFDMPGVIRGGEGTLHGELGWRGAPIAPVWKDMAGSLHLDVGHGQFLKAEPGLAKLLSVLSLQSLPRRIGLDFRDVFSSGFAFDFVRGDVRVEKGIARTNNLQMKGVNAAVLMEGQASLVDETQQLRVVVVPEINAMTASLVATAINPVIGLGSFLAQAVLRGPMVAAATREFHISGSWADPQVKQVARGQALGGVDTPAEGELLPANEEEKP